ncbi:MAG: type II toxin-antitoxin system VapC family toxin [Thermoanaerobaculia bacterium]
MRFWDSSALVPLLVEEDLTVATQELFFSEPGIIVWWGTPVECASAVSRLEREGRLSPQEATDALERLDVLARYWHRIEPVDAVLETARASSGSIPFVPPILSNLLPLFSRPKGGPRRSSSSALTTGLRPLPSGKDSVL